MEREFDALRIRELRAGAGFRRPSQAQAERVTPESAAMQVLTDFTRVSPATIRPQAPLSGANRFMITRGVRLLLVVGHVLETLRRAGRQHALVSDAEGMVRGVFSISQIARQLGVAPPVGGEVARTFAEIEAALSG